MGSLQAPYIDILERFDSHFRTEKGVTGRQYCATIELKCKGRYRLCHIGVGLQIPPPISFTRECGMACIRIGGSKLYMHGFSSRWTFPLLTLVALWPRAESERRQPTRSFSAASVSCIYPKGKGEKKCITRFDPTQSPYLLNYEMASEAIASPMEPIISGKQDDLSAPCPVM